jgi:CDP-glucose 4,6-dehydratase
MGTINLLDVLRVSGGVRSFVNVTTDKVYKNKEIPYGGGYVEDEPLGGYDPYSNSKSCSELVTQCYKDCFLSDDNVAVSTARAGNVIGGGDFANDRIIPDCVRAVTRHEKIAIRNPASVRPYQHVLEPIFAYLMIAEKQYEDLSLAGSYNIGPDENDCITTKELVELFCKYWNSTIHGYGIAEYVMMPETNAPHEAKFLRLDSGRIKKVFNWDARWSIETAIEKTVELTKTFLESGNVGIVMAKQEAEYR